VTVEPVSVDLKPFASLFGRQKKDIIREYCFYDRKLGRPEMLIFVDSEDTVGE